MLHAVEPTVKAEYRGRAAHPARHCGGQLVAVSAMTLHRIKASVLGCRAAAVHLELLLYKQQILQFERGCQGRESWDLTGREYDS